MYSFWRNSIDLNSTYVVIKIRKLKLKSIAAYILKKKKQFNPAFSLIELLVVVAILGILSTVGIISYGGYVNSTKLKSADNILLQISLAQTEYYSGNGSYYTQSSSKCKPSAELNTKLVNALGVSIPDDVEFEYCTEENGSSNYTIRALSTSIKGKSKYCEITMDNISNKPKKTNEDDCG